MNPGDCKNKTCNHYETYLQILRAELVPALGCTEPIAIAYAAAVARRVLGEMPKRIIAACSSNIIKNVKSVIVPPTGDLRGIEARAILGAVAGRADRELEVLSCVQPEDVEQTRRLLESGMCKTELLRSDSCLHIRITAESEAHTAMVEIRDEHTRIIRVERDSEPLYTAQPDEQKDEPCADYQSLNVADIYAFACTVQIEEVQEILDRQITYNLKIAEEGLAHCYGASVGVTLLKSYGDDIKNVARAFPAAGSDARMSGCVLPVVINSGSGNQGMTASLLVIKYAQHIGATREQLYRALVLSNLIAIHQKTGLGRLSAYCGAVSAAVGSGAAITYLYGGSYEAVCDTITNTIANVSGIVCDGAKPSCAAKIASAVDAAILGHCMALQNRSFRPGDGIVRGDVEDTIRGVGRIGRDGMRETDEEILNIMLEKIS